MKKLSLTVIASLFSLAALAQDTQPKHIISIGTDGFGWSAFGQTYDWDKDKSGIKDHETSSSNLKLNYSYVFPNRIMLGAILDVETSESELKETNGEKTKSEENGTEFGISLGYNFNEDVFNSWWIQAVISSGRYEEETKDSSGKSDFDYNYSAFYIKGGKRINLDSWGLKNVSYNPSLSIASAKVSGDAEDAGLEKMAQVQLDIIKIDILF